MNGKNLWSAAAILVAVAAIYASTVNGKPQDPAYNLPLPASLVNGCFDKGHMDSPECSALAFKQLNVDREKGGLPAYSLPGNWKSLTPVDKLFILTNLDRVDRGLPPISGVLNSLNSVARSAAEHDRDPTLNSKAARIIGGNPRNLNWVSNWSGSGNIYLNELGWMYEDGLPKTGKSPIVNIDCKTPGGKYCWGHRNNILIPVGISSPFQPGYETAMGGYVSRKSTAEIFANVYKRKATRFVYTWADAVRDGVRVPKATSWESRLLNSVSKTIL